MKNRLIFLLIVLLPLQTLLAQTFDKARLDQYFDALERNNKFMGSVAVSKDNKVIYTRSAGFANVEKAIKNSAATRYRIGSISKTFTAVLVFKMAEEKKLSLDDRLAKFFPTIPNAEKITIRQLLHHRSGIHNFTSDAAYLSWNTMPKSQSEMVATIAKGVSDFEPDTRAEYSNSNYVLLTYILEKASGKSYAALLQNHIIKPAGLTDTYLGGSAQNSDADAKSYRFMGSWLLQPDTDPSIPLGAGAIVSTPADLIRFSEALFRGKLLTPEQLAQMQTLRDGYGAGLFEIPFYDKKAFGHTGGIDGFYAVFAHFADDDLTYALTSNGVNYNANDISIAVLSTVFGKTYPIPSFEKTSLSPAELKPYEGVFASAQIPLKITITQNNGQLIGQATGQQSFPLEAAGNGKFTFTAAGLELDFGADGKTMTLKQGGGSYAFTKE